ncbi:MAG TPA: D-alanyl-D-alanine carboxypeptidase/D-alanyl-D-alanine-endopeptidase [Gammaproteobacteria bacterium]|nr:D-alanyl-D-alanine carboxypeptidase/D-alanyl-D-alanine-endopeptidase [Gammaproteobacteria bacterium]
MPLKRTALLALIAFAPTVYADNYNQQVADIVNKTLSENTQPKYIGIKIQSLQTGQVLYTKNADRLFVPASNLKLFTALGAFLSLSPNFTFQTQLLTDNKNIYIKFDGDPSFTDSDLNNLFVSLKKSGVNTITGNIYLDSHLLGGRNAGPGWMWDELNICYAAPINSIMINHNCVNYTLSPDASLKPQTSADVVNIINQATVSDNDPKNCPLDLTTTGSNAYALTGCIPKNSKPINLSIALTNPEQHAKQLILQDLKNNQIDFKGEILEKMAPAGTQIISTHFSDPLSSIIRTMMKNSDDQIAAILLKTVGEHYYQEPTNWGKSVDALKAILKQNTQINLHNAVIVDGSGISRYNLISPDQISELLDIVFHDKTIAKPYIESLPIAGKDGTLQNRMIDYKGKVYAKTGSMTGVESLSGYIQTKHHSVLSFVILMNNFSMSGQQASALEDKIAERLANT